MNQVDPRSLGREPLAEPQKKRRGCVFYGCLSAVVVSVLVVVGIYFAAGKLNSKVREYAASLVKDYASTAPIDFALPALTESDYRVLRGRLDQFRKSIESGSATTPLKLSGEEINALLYYDPEFKTFKDKVRIKIKNGQIHGTVSVPLEIIPFYQDIFSGHYINGEATFKIRLVEGVLIVKLLDVTVNGKPLPDKIMNKLREENLVDTIKDERQKKKLRDFVRKFSEIKVKGSYIYLIPAGSGQKPL